MLYCKQGLIVENEFRYSRKGQRRFILYLAKVLRCLAQAYPQMMPFSVSKLD
jgi:hypothetical protein